MSDILSEILLYDDAYSIPNEKFECGYPHSIYYILFNNKQQKCTFFGGARNLSVKSNV